MKDWLVAVAFFASMPAFAATAPKPDSDTDQIKGIVETFRTAVASKNKVAFQKLFFNESIPWIGVTSESGLKILISRKKDPSQPDPSKIYSVDNPIKFINGLIASPEKFEESFSNVVVQNDGNIAQVYFDYRFTIDSYETNSGKESWQLVHTTDGWKINSVIWSMDINPALPKAQ